METKHTKGEWKVSEEPFSLLVTHEINPNHVESICQISQRYKSDSEQLANAKLIAAAPDMLEALILCQQDFFNGNIGNKPSTETREKIRKAIKKATE